MTTNTPKVEMTTQNIYLLNMTDYVVSIFYYFADTFFLAIKRLFLPRTYCLNTGYLVSKFLKFFEYF
jgi:hypothetical protein